MILYDYARVYTYYTIKPVLYRCYNIMSCIREDAEITNVERFLNISLKINTIHHPSDSDNTTTYFIFVCYDNW